MSKDSKKSPGEDFKCSPKNTPDSYNLQSAILNINSTSKLYKNPLPQIPSLKPLSTPPVTRRIKGYDKDVNEVLKPLHSLSWSRPAGVDKLTLFTSDFSLESSYTLAKRFMDDKPVQQCFTYYDEVVKKGISADWGSDIITSKYHQRKKETALKKFTDHIELLKLFNDSGGGLEFDLPDMDEWLDKELAKPITSSTLPTFAQPHLLTTSNGEEIFGKSLYVNDPDGKYKVDITRYKDVVSCRVQINPSKYLNKFYADLASIEDIKTVLADVEKVLYERHSLKLNLSHSRIYRVDFAKDRKMNHHVFSYEKVFGLLKLKRATQQKSYPTGYHQENSVRSYTFYDKAVEHFENRIHSSPFMRGEYRLKQTKSCEGFGLKTVSDLYSYEADGLSHVYNMLINKDVLCDDDKVDSSKLVEFVDIPDLVRSLQNQGRKRNVLNDVLLHYSAEKLLEIYTPNQLKSLFMESGYKRNHARNMTDKICSYVKTMKTVDKVSLSNLYHELKDKFAA